jgi:hypothetical protein
MRKKPRLRVTEKHCSKCHQLKKAEEFSPSKWTADFLVSQCHACHTKSETDRRKTPEGKRSALSSYLKSRYGITLNDFETILAQQGGRCAICKQTDIKTKGRTRFDVDHDHKTKKVRGILCTNCNRVLGLVHEDVVVLGNLIAYLLVHWGFIGRAEQ